MANVVFIYVVWAASAVAAFSGDMTYFHQGIGACGQVHSDNDPVVALSAYDFGDETNPNKAAVCGRWIRISHANGKSTRAQVWDKCPESQCDSGSIDVSPTVFQQIIDLPKGRTEVTWEFEDSISRTNTMALNSIDSIASIATVTVTITVNA